MTAIGYRIGKRFCPRQLLPTFRRSSALAGSSPRWIKKSVATGMRFLLLCLLGVGFLPGCAGDSQRTARSWTTPAQHAASQVQWLRARAGNLTPAELQLLKQVPWRADGSIDGDRQRLFDLTQDSDTSIDRSTRRRVLGRPRVMDAAQQELRERQEQDKPSSSAAVNDGANYE